jgi:hypothetical protein
VFISTLFLAFLVCTGWHNYLKNEKWNFHSVYSVSARSRRIFSSNKHVYPQKAQISAGFFGTSLQNVSVQNVPRVILIWKYQYETIAILFLSRWDNYFNFKHRWIITDLSHHGANVSTMNPNFAIWNIDQTDAVN